MSAVARSPPPSDAAATAEAAQLASAKVGLLGALIWPLSVEKRYWNSKVFQAAAEEHDGLHLLMRLASEWLQMFLVQPALPTDVARPFRAISIKSAALVLTHMAFKVLAPATYWRYRWLGVAHFRQGHACAARTPALCKLPGQGLLSWSRRTLAQLNCAASCTKAGALLPEPQATSHDGHLAPRSTLNWPPSRSQVVVPVDHARPRHDHSGHRHGAVLPLRTSSASLTLVAPPQSGEWGW
jgi:hypothetical protein